MIWVGSVFAILMLGVALVRADLHLHTVRLRLQGLYTLEWLQYRTGLRTQQEIELAVDALPRADRLFALPRERVAAFPRRWLLTGPDHPLPNLAAGAGVVSFLAGAWAGDPSYEVLALSGAYLMLCFGWDLWVVSWFDFQAEPHDEAARSRAHDALTDAIDQELEHDDYDLLTQTQLLEHLARSADLDLQRAVSSALTDRGNAPTVKFIYWLVGALGLAWRRRQRRQARALTRNVCDLAKLTQLPKRERLLRRIRQEIDDQRERALLGDADEAEPRLERLRRIEADLARGVNA